MTISCRLERRRARKRDYSNQYPCATGSTRRAGDGRIRALTSSAFDVLRDYLEARAAFDAEDFDLIRTVFLFKRLSAGDFLQRAGDITRHAAFVASGCLRNYVIDAKGKEHIVQFAPETWWLADATSLNSGSPSSYFKDQRIVSSLSASAEERYLEFMKTYSSIALRVPQSMLASYLGVTPETVSRIRKSLSRR